MKAYVILIYFLLNHKKRITKQYWNIFNNLKLKISFMNRFLIGEHENRYCIKCKNYTNTILVISITCDECGNNE